jgi:hypothetical protein
MRSRLRKSRGRRALLEKADPRCPFAGERRRRDGEWRDE